jgi:3-hydroxyacyl-[acyl-carrier-protein] dehydratase
MSSMDINEIMAYLPHRFPFLLVDRVISLEPGKSIPKHPVMPGVLILEALAQAAALLSFKTVADMPNEDSVVYFAGIDAARFKKPVMPGDQLIMHVEILRNLKGIWKYATYAEVDGQRVAEAEMMATLR